MNLQVSAAQLEWISLASKGTDITAVASLPFETADSLYHDILLYGPNGENVQRLFVDLHNWLSPRSIYEQLQPFESWIDTWKDLHRWGHPKSRPYSEVELPREVQRNIAPLKEPHRHHFMGDGLEALLLAAAVDGFCAGRVSEETRFRMDENEVLFSSALPFMGLDPNGYWFEVSSK